MTAEGGRARLRSAMSPMTRGSMPRPSDRAKAAFTDLLPEDDAVVTRPMFGNLSAFVNGNMFCGLFGEDLFVRVSDEDQAKIRKQGGRPFEPMPGRAMTGYVVLPGGWQKKTDTTRDWIVVALRWSKKLPPKVKAAKPAGSKATAAGRRSR